MNYRCRYINLLLNVPLLRSLKIPGSRIATTICFVVLVFTNSFGQAPVANFTSDKVSGCAPLIVTFQDLSTNTPTSWIWDFGNGVTSTGQNPITNFSVPGTYTVKLIARNNAGVDEEVKVNYITVFPSPTPAFTANITTACVPATIQFTDQTTVPPGAGTITDWLWNFGDGGTSTSQNPSHTYTAAGFYTVSLQVTSSTGCQSFKSIGRYIRIISGIDVDFVHSQPNTCKGPFDISFSNQSSGPGNLTYLWNFGNGGPTSTLENPTATYSSAGTYPVSLTIQSDLGCNGTITKNIIVSVQPFWVVIVSCRL